MEPGPRKVSATRSWHLEVEAEVVHVQRRRAEALDPHSFGPLPVVVDVVQQVVSHPPFAWNRREEEESKPSEEEEAEEGDEEDRDPDLGWSGESSHCACTSPRALRSPTRWAAPPAPPPAPPPPSASPPPAPAQTLRPRSDRAGRGRRGRTSAVPGTPVVVGKGPSQSRSSGSRREDQNGRGNDRRRRRHGCHCRGHASPWWLWRWRSAWFFAWSSPGAASPGRQRREDRRSRPGEERSEVDAPKQVRLLAMGGHRGPPAAAPPSAASAGGGAGKGEKKAVEPSSAVGVFESGLSSKPIKAFICWSSLFFLFFPHTRRLPWRRTTSWEGTPPEMVQVPVRRRDGGGARLDGEDRHGGPLSPISWPRWLQLVRWPLDTPSGQRHSFLI